MVDSETMATFQYTMNDYTSIMFGTAENKAMSYKLPAETIAIIQGLIKKMGLSLQQTTTTDYKPRQMHNQNRYNSSNARINEESWISVRDFKPTTIIEKKEGGEKIMNEIRIALNKISAKNYDVNRDTILSKIKELNGLTNDATNAKDSSSVTTDITKVANNIFEIASTNKFFSEIYAKLYKELSAEFPDIFTTILNTFITGFTETMKTIRYVDQTANYDEFCKYNKENDKRKATTVFITNLVKIEVISTEVLICMAKDILRILDEYMNEEGRVNEVEEITENIFLLLTNHLDIANICKDTEIYETVRQISTMKPKDKASISSRAIFKYMDMLDKWNIV